MSQWTHPRAHFLSEKGSLINLARIQSAVLIVISFVKMFALLQDLSKTFPKIVASLCASSPHLGTNWRSGAGVAVRPGPGARKAEEEEGAWG